MTSISLSGTDWRCKPYVGDDWRMRRAYAADTRDVHGWFPATVPGSPYADLMAAGELPDLYYDRNTMHAEWVAERWWVWRRVFRVGARSPRTWLRFEGVDHACEVYLNGELVGCHEGMFRAFEYEVSERLLDEGDNVLAVAVAPVPRIESQVGHTSRVRTHKTRMSYWWDFCPRLPQLGIWDDVMLLQTGPARLRDVWVRGTTDGEVVVNCDIDVPDSAAAVGNLDGGHTTMPSAHANVEAAWTVEVTLTHGGDVVAQGRARAGSPVKLQLESPRLWWPNGHGEPSLYEAEIWLVNQPNFGAGGSDRRERDGAKDDANHRDGAEGDANHRDGGKGDADRRDGGKGDAGGRNGRPSDSRSVRFGLRDVRMHDYALEVNGQRVYMRGWNWVPHDMLYGVRDLPRLRRLLDMARRAHVNVLRVWGGGLIEREEFYSLCDEFGIMVWQEFIQSSSGMDNRPADDDEFVAMMRAEAEAIVPRRRNHPSLIIWCGGNELQGDDGRPLDDTAPVLAALREVVRRLDPTRIWLPTSPSGPTFMNTLANIERDPDGQHDVHGPWEYQGLEAQCTLYNRATSRLHSEFGVEGMASRETQNRTIPAEKQWPFAKSNAAWMHRGSWWMNPDMLQQCFGDRLTDLDRMTRASRFLQAEGLRYAIEANRRRCGLGRGHDGATPADHGGGSSRNAGSLPWQFNEPFPNGSCTSAIEHHGAPKPAYYAVARAYAALSVTARFDRLAWGGHDRFTAELFAVSSHAAPNSMAGLVPPVPGAAVLHVCLVGASGRVYFEERRPVLIEPGHAQPLGSVDVDLPDEDLFFLDLVLGPATNRYLFSSVLTLAPLLDAPATTLDVSLRGDVITLLNSGSYAALDVWLEEDGLRLYDDNGFALLPGEQRRVRTLGDTSHLKVSASNTEPLWVSSSPGKGDAQCVSNC
jgi:beta-mannosidase